MQMVLIWDKRDAAKPTNKVENAHDAEINCLTFNPNNEFLLGTGGADKVVALWDMRSMNKPLHKFEGNEDEILQLQWAPFTESIFASSSADRRVRIWDIARIGQEQTDEEKLDGPPELLFIHGGCVCHFCRHRCGHLSSSCCMFIVFWWAPPLLKAHNVGIRFLVERQQKRRVGHRFCCGGQRSAGVADGSESLRRGSRRGLGKSGTW